MTPLCLCILYNNLAMAKHLHAAGASPLPARNNGESVMCFAALAQNAHLIRWLVSLPFPTRTCQTRAVHAPFSCPRTHPAPKSNPPHLPKQKPTAKPP